MKFRNGFVSNSSSSSFVLITTVEEWERVKQVAHPYRVAVAEAIKSGPFEAFGEQFVKFSTWSNHGASWGEYTEVDYDGEKSPSRWDDEGEDMYEAWDHIKKEFQDGKYIAHDQDVG